MVFFSFISPSKSASKFIYTHRKKKIVYYIYNYVYTYIYGSGVFRRSKRGPVALCGYGMHPSGAFLGQKREIKAIELEEEKEVGEKAAFSSLVAFLITAREGVSI